MRKTFIPFALATLLASTAAQAQSDARIDHRQANQRERIHQGVASGDLTRREAGRLIGQQRDIRRTERRFAADGVVGARERAVLNHQLNYASRNIARQRHDAQRRDFMGYRSSAWGKGGRYGNPGRHYGYSGHGSYFGHRPAPRHYRGGHVGIRRG